MVKRLTIKDIAKECNVSIATVSNVLNGKGKAGSETREKILEAVQRTGYKPNGVAKGLRSSKSRLIGIIAEDISHFSVPPIVEGIMNHLESAGYRGILINLRLYQRFHDSWFEKEELIWPVREDAIEDLRSMMVDGIIYVAVHARKTSAFPKDFSIPAVMAYAMEVNPAIPTVLPDDVMSAYLAVKQLIENGHRSIGIIAGYKNNQHSIWRISGIQKAFDEAGLTLEPEHLIYAGWEREEGYEAMEKLSAQKDITAVFCMSDRLAGGVYEYLDECGLRVGKDLSVIGFDGQQLSEFLTPPLSTMELPLGRIGEEAASICIDEIENGPSGDSAQTVKFPCSFLSRESVRKLE
ncbi:MAG: LacI family DNA-binding transcriptional regulator [Lachnospiraceae bacterium]|nr:LacI family DNA-binding transcriptional regulator [Lachnospiraceae bacterium]